MPQKYWENINIQNENLFLRLVQILDQSFLADFDAACFANLLNKCWWTRSSLSWTTKTFAYQSDYLTQPNMSVALRCPVNL